MYHLILTVCLAAAPDQCSQRLLPAAESPDREECLHRGLHVANDWAVRHTKLKAGKIDCVPIEAVPALEMTNPADDIYLRAGTPDAPSKENLGRVGSLGFIVGDTVAVIDAGTSRAEGEALYAAIRRVTDRPVSHLVLTGMRPEALLGAEVFAEAGASIIAHHELPRQMTRQRKNWLPDIATGIGAATFTGTRLPTIDRTIDTPVTLDLGDRAVDLVPLPPAQSDSDLTALDRESGTLWVGALIGPSDATPAVEGALKGWLDWTPTGADGEAPQLVVPARGPAMSDWSAPFDQQHRYLTALGDTIRTLRQQGIPLKRAIPATVLALEEFAQTWPDFRAVTARNAGKVYGQIR